MKKKQIIDVTGTQLTPSKQGRKCLGNDNHPEYECCCDECDYYLYCFPGNKGKVLLSPIKNSIRDK